MKKTNLAILLTSCLEVQVILLDSMDFNLGKEVKFVKKDWSLIHACWNRSIMRSVCKTYIRSYRIIEILDGFKTSSKLFFEAHITLLNYIIRLHLLMPLENIKHRIVYVVSIVNRDMKCAIRIYFKLLRLSRVLLMWSRCKI